MKRCPFCAEDIQTEAIFCRYCGRKVRGRYNRLISIVIVTAMLTTLYWSHKNQVDVSVRRFVAKSNLAIQSFIRIIEELPEALKGIKTYNERAASIDKALGESLEGSKDKQAPLT